MNQEAYVSHLLPLHALPPGKFETPRLSLRLIEPQDAAVLFELYAADPDATRYMSFKCTGKLEDTQYYVDWSSRYSRGEESPIEHHSWLITLKETGEPIGSTGFGPKTKYSLAGGYILARAHWGKGYATEAWKCLVDWAKQQPGVFRIEASHHPDNMASGKVLVKSGDATRRALKASLNYA